MEYARSRIEYQRTTSRAGSIVFRGDAGFLSHFKSNNIEDALKHYHERYKDSYLQAYYIDEYGMAHFLINRSNPNNGESDYIITMNWSDRTSPQAKWLPF